MDWQAGSEENSQLGRFGPGLRTSDVLQEDFGRTYDPDVVGLRRDGVKG